MSRKSAMPPQKPEVMLLDEPTSYIDMQHKANICQLLKEISQDKGITTVVVFDNIGLPACFSDQVMMIKEGKIHGIGPL